MFTLVIAALAVMQGPVTSVPPQRYRLEVKTLNELDQTPLGRPKLSGGLVTSAIISVTVTDTAGGQIARIVVDSMTLDPSGEIATSFQRRPTAAADARGASVRFMVSNGKVQGAPQMSDSTNPALTGILQAVGVLFPGIRHGAKVGDSWADTSAINIGAAPRPLTHGRVVAAWKVSGAEGDALVLDGTSTSETRTEDSSNGQTMTLTGGTKERVVIPPNGPVRRASIESSNMMSVSVPGLATPLPGKTTGSLTLTPIP